MSLTGLLERNRRVTRSRALDLARQPDLAARSWEVSVHGLKDGLLTGLGYSLSGAGAPS